MDEKRKEEEFCEGCGIGELRKIIDGLVEKLVGKSVVEKPVVVVKSQRRVIIFQKGE